MRRLLRLSLAASLVLPTALLAQAPAPGSITIGTRDSVWSAALNESRPYFVYTPPSYNDTTYLPRAYPVLYILDGEAHFHSMTGLIQILGTGVNGTFVVPEMIVVAIPNTKDRMGDLTPTHAENGPDGKPFPMPMNTTGRMPKFLQFVQKELIPRIDSAYRTAPYRVFVGHSLGGITAIQALYTMPQTFNAYVAIDPSLWWDDQLLLRQSRAYFSKQGGLEGRSLFVAQANTINPSDSTPNVHSSAIMQFNGVVQSYNATGLRYGYRYYGDDSHGSVPLIAEYDALRFIFKDYNLDLMRSIEQPAYLTAHYAKVSKSLGYEVQPAESMVDMLGQIQQGRDKAKALELFQLNTTLYPRSAHAWVALGNASLVSGDSTQARTAFARALEVNPKNAQAKEAIGKLPGR